MKTFIRFAKIFSLAFMLACTFTVFASAEIIRSGTAGESIKWTLDNSGKVVITGSGEMDISKAASWRTRKDDITFVEIGNGITFIDDSAFRGCKNLVSVVLPDSITEIGYYAFKECISLREITIPESVTTIHYECFEDCTSLRSIIIPDSVTHLGDGAFRGCSALEEAALSENMTTVEDELFRNCSSLKKVIIPNGVISTNAYVFNGCTSLKTLVLPETLGWFGLFGLEGYSITSYNKDTLFRSEMSKASSLSGYIGSTIHEQALKYNIPFIPLEDPTVTLPEFKVTLGGIEFNNTYAKYPLIVYKNITYLPMTYFDSRLLGLDTEYSPENGLAIKALSGDAPEYSSEKLDVPNAKSYTASLANGKITVNGKRIYNHAEEYPLLLFRDVTYFPLTWRFAVEEFGWNYSFDSENGLVVEKAQ